ncbi:hypothetical protein J3R83DRAFT_9624 [Lanmaoa asiatica]|nr:hypothetical protein J3R83DRAFT_9624 [Lanmaoa asiatica]
MSSLSPLTQSTRLLQSCIGLYSRTGARLTSLRAQASQAQTLIQDEETGFGFIRSNRHTQKPRKLGVTEIRGPYYTAYGKRHLQDVPETMGYHIDGFKFAGGSSALFPERAVMEMIELAHKHDVYVSTVRLTGICRRVYSALTYTHWAWYAFRVDGWSMY